MTLIENFGAIEHLSITILVDNRADLMVESTETVKRFQDEPLLAEHGFSALIHLDNSERAILWDAGVTRTTCSAPVSDAPQPASSKIRPVKTIIHCHFCISNLFILPVYVLW